MNILFVASVAIVTPQPARSRKLFVDALSLPLKRQDGDDYYFSEDIPGAKHFGVWPLSQAAEACFGMAEWPRDRPVPHACRTSNEAALVELAKVDLSLAMVATHLGMADRGHAATRAATTIAIRPRASRPMT